MINDTPKFPTEKQATRKSKPAKSGKAAHLREMKQDRPASKRSSIQTFTCG